MSRQKRLVAKGAQNSGERCCAFVIVSLGYYRIVLLRGTLLGERKDVILLQLPEFRRPPHGLFQVHHAPAIDPVDTWGTYVFCCRKQRVSDLRILEIGKARLDHR